MSSAKFGVAYLKTACSAGTSAAIVVNVNRNSTARNAYSNPQLDPHDPSVTMETVSFPVTGTHEQFKYDCNERLQYMRLRLILKFVRNKLKNP